MTRHRLSRRDARRVAVRAQWLHRDRPADLLELVRHVTLLQIDPTAAVAPSADLVAWSRLGSAYDRAELERALEERELVEFRGTIRPAEDMVLYRAEMDAFAGPEPMEGWVGAQRRWVAANDGCRRNILRRLEEAGPLVSRALPDTCVVPWKSSGWNDDKNVPMLLEMMVKRGEVAVAGRHGRERLWDLAERVYPTESTVPLEEAAQRRDARRLSALGIARSKGPECPVEPLDVGSAGEEAEIDGVRGTWRVDPALLDQPFAGRAVLLSPFDRVLHDRKRMVELFEFEYALEMFKPAAKRKWGYFALPVLYGDRLVGKLDATSDRKHGVFRVDAVHWDAPPTKAMEAAVDKEIRDLARWLRLDLVLAD